MSKMTTIILTGGAGTRMRPLSLDKTKSMIFFMGRPLMQHLVNDLKRYEILDIVSTSRGIKGEIKEYFSAGERFGINLNYYSGKIWLGTAGTIRNLICEMNDMISNPFMVIYGDSLLKANYQKMSQFHIHKKSWCTILYHRPNFESFLYEYHDKSYEEKGKRTNYGVMDIASDNRITKVIEKPLLREIKRKFINPVANATVYILDKKILDFISPDKSFDFPGDLFPLLVRNKVPCFGFDINKGYRIDMGTLPFYYATHFAILDGKIDFAPYFPLLKKGIWVGKGSRIKSMNNLKKPALICENSRIDLDTNIECSIIGNNVHIGKFSSIRKSIILDNVHIGNRVNISHSIIGENSFIQDEVSLPPNTVLGNYCHLGGSQVTMKESDFFGLIRR